MQNIKFSLLFCSFLFIIYRNFCYFVWKYIYIYLLYESEQTIERRTIIITLLLLLLLLVKLCMFLFNLYFNSHLFIYLRIFFFLSFEIVYIYIYCFVAFYIIFIKLNMIMKYICIFYFKFIYCCFIFWVVCF